MKSPLLHLASQIFDQPLAIVPEKLEIILSAVGPRLVADQASLDAIFASGALLSRRENKLPSDFVARLSYGATGASGSAGPFDDDDDDDDDEDPLTTRSSRPYKLSREGVATLPIRGALLKRGGWMTSMSGCSSYEQVGAAFRAALADSACKAILLDIDSPGGSVHGCFELADLIHASRSIKPSMAIANDLSASAAYAIASSAGSVMLTRTGGVGSIGVFCLHRDQSGLDSKLGLTYTYIFAGDHKVDGNPHEPLSKTASSSLQALVDSSYDIFVDTVARNRNADRKKIINTKAETLLSADAIPLLADSIGDYAAALAQLTSKVSRPGATIFSQGASTAQSGLTGKAGTGNEAGTKTGESTMTPTAEQLAALKKAADDANAALLAATTSQTTNDAEFTARAAALGYVPKNALKLEQERLEKAEADRLAAKAAADKLLADQTAQAARDRAAQVEGNTPNDAVSQIAQLCLIGGKPELLATFLAKKSSVQDVMKELGEIRAKESASTSVNPNHAPVTTLGIDQALTATEALVASSGGKLSKSKALEQVLRANPRIYEQAQEEKHLALSTPARRREYIGAMKSRMAAFGLSAGA